MKPFREFVFPWSGKRLDRGRRTANPRLERLEDRFVPSTSPNVAVSVVADQTTLGAGSTAGYVITLTNTGNSTASGVTLSDPLPSGLGKDVNWQIDTTTGDPNNFVLSGAVGGQKLSLVSNTTLSAGASIEVHVTGATSTADTSAATSTGMLSDTAVVSAANEPFAKQNQKATATITIDASNVAITQTADHATVGAGNTVGETITLTNKGKAATSGLTLSDSLPAGLGNDVTWSLDTTVGTPGDFVLSGAVGSQKLSLASNTILTAGSSITVHITGVTSTADTSATTFTDTLSNTATVNASNEATANRNQKSSNTITIDASDAVVTQTADHTTVNGGGGVGYIITVTNKGKAATSGLTLSDSLPAGAGNDIRWIIDKLTGNPRDFILSGSVGAQTLTLSPNIALGAGGSIRVHLTAVTTANDGGALSNTATVNATNEASANQNQSATSSITVKTPDVGVTETADKSNITPGGRAGYTITLTNTGNTTASGLTLSDSLPAGAGKDIKWIIDRTKGNPIDFVLSGAVGSQKLRLASGTTLAAGASLTIHITGVTTTSDAGTLSNTATVNASNEATANQNQSATTSITVSSGSGGSSGGGSGGSGGGSSGNTGAISVTLSSPADSNTGSAVTFVADVSGSPSGTLSYNWAFGDGTTQTTTTPVVSYSYANAGGYTATVTVTDAANDQASNTAGVQVSSASLQDVTLDGTSYALAGSAVSFSVGNPNQPPAGGFTYTWNFGDGSTATTGTPTTSHTYNGAGNYITTVTVSDTKGDALYSSTAVMVNAASDTSDPLFKPVVNSGSFTYLGSFALPQSANNWDTAYSMGGLAYRYVNGNLQFFTTNHIYSGGLVYSFTDPGYSTDPNNLPQAQVITNWGDIYTGQKEFGGDTNIGDTWTYGLYYDQGSGRLYWSYGNSYNDTYQYNPSIGYSTLNDSKGTATGVGAWSLSNRPEKFDRGGILQIPSWFATDYTNGDTLAAGFGGYFSINSTASMGPALAAFAAPTSSTADDSALSNIPLLGYPSGAPDRAHRDTSYTSYYDGGTYPGTPGQWNPANGTGYWTWSDSIFDAGSWIDTPTMQGVLFIAKEGQGNVYYQTSDRHAQSGDYLWMVYNPADLAAVASGAKQQWQIQPQYEWTTPSLPFGPFDQANGNGYTGDGMSNIGGVVFDPTTNRLYVLEEGALSNGYEAWPEMAVYQVGPPPTAATSGNPIVVGDTGSGFSTTATGWKTLANGYGGESMQLNTSTSATATWQASGLASGSYTLSVDWNAQPNKNTDKAVYQIYDGSTLVGTVTVNQQQTPTGDVVGGNLFQSLGTFSITSGKLKVVATNADGGSLAADALQISPA